MWQKPVIRFQNSLTDVSSYQVIATQSQFWVGQVWWCDSNWYAIDAAAVVVGAGPPPGPYPGTETVP